MGRGRSLTPRRRRAEPEAPPPIELTLIIDGASERSAQAIIHTHRVCAHLAAGHALRVVDIREDDGDAPVDGMVAAPMLVRRRPLPVRRVAGDLSATDRVLAALDLP